MTQEQRAAQQAIAERFTRTQSCNGDPDTCGCGGTCPAWNHHR